MTTNGELPAFPTWERTGLTKREYIAALLMPAMLHRFGRGQTTAEAASDAVNAADQLLSTLEK